MVSSVATGVSHSNKPEELQLQNYLDIFQKALQEQKPPSYNEQELRQLAKKFYSLPDTWGNLYKVLWLEHALKNQKYVKITEKSTDQGIQYTLTILKDALGLSRQEFCNLVQPLVFHRGSHTDDFFVIEGKKYSASAIVLFLELDYIEPSSLSPTSSVTLNLKNQAKMKLTRAEFQMLTRRQMSWEEKAETCQANWHAYDQAVIEFVYQVNVELGGDHRWDASHSSDFLCRVMQFAEKEIPDCDYSLL